MIDIGLITHVPSNLMLFAGQYLRVPAQVSAQPPLPRRVRPGTRFISISFTMLIIIINVRIAEGPSLDCVKMLRMGAAILLLELPSLSITFFTPSKADAHLMCRCAA